ncbi:hypothetical protein [Arthrobacter sp. CAN_C5]|uniref:hypothetical protein n=1 Tax=Arthrobacter sp. CAN_C5 TaxID=2760706 RepID=UPI001AE51249|nr:hypothetical protein [Arthrobacter sp. CAN_C5]MBP2215988.1 hypothetical protein [Arthrobacter sp. CAN_C5]
MTTYDWLYAVVNIAILVLFIVMGFRAMMSSWREWRQTWRQPIISVSFDEISQMEPEWPLSGQLGGHRWPNPFPSDEDQMKPAMAAAFGRAAAVRERTHRYRAEVILILAAAFLGVQLQEILTGDNEWTVLSELWDSVYPALIGLAGLAIGLSLRFRAEQLHVAKSYYEEASRADSSSHDLPVLKDRGRSGIVARLLSAVLQ